MSLGSLWKLARRVMGGRSTDVASSSTAVPVTGVEPESQPAPKELIDTKVVKLLENQGFVHVSGREGLMVFMTAKVQNGEGVEPTVGRCADFARKAEDKDVFDLISIIYFGKRSDDRFIVTSAKAGEESISDCRYVDGAELLDQIGGLDIVEYFSNVRNPQRRERKPPAVDPELGNHK